MIGPRPQLAALIAAALLGASGCGSDDEPGPGIPRASAEQLSRELDLVQERIDVTREQSKPGSCNDVESKSYRDIQTILDGVPADTDADVRRALERSIDRLKELTASECSRLIEEIEERQQESTPEVTTPPPPVQNEPPPEQTQTQTTPPEEKPKKEKPPKEDDFEDGGASPDEQQGPSGQDGGGQPAPDPQGE